MCSYFVNRLRFDRIMVVSLAPFFGPPCNSVQLARVFLCQPVWRVIFSIYMYSVYIMCYDIQVESESYIYVGSIWHSCSISRHFCCNFCENKSLLFNVSPVFAIFLSFYS